MTDTPSTPNNPIPPAAAEVPASDAALAANAPVSPAAPAAPAESAPGAAAPATPATAPVTPAATPAAPAPSFSQTLGKILAVAASVVQGILPTVPVGAITLGAAAAESGLRALSEFLITKGSDNALTEAQAETELQNLLASLATVANPLPAPADIEAKA